MKGGAKEISYATVGLCQRLRRNFFSLVFWLLCAGAIMLVYSQVVISQDISPELKVEHRVISIQEQAGLVPTTVIIKRGTTVVWLNYSKEPNVIKFQNKKVTTACRSPINFFLADNGSYQSIPLKIGAVASLCFIEKGTFEYQIKSPNPDWNIDPQLLRGIIKVY